MKDIMNEIKPIMGVENIYGWIYIGQKKYKVDLKVKEETKNAQKTQTEEKKI